MLSTLVAVSCSSLLSLSVMSVNSTVVIFMPFLPCLCLKETIHGRVWTKWHLREQGQVHLHSSKYASILMLTSVQIRDLPPQDNEDHNTESCKHQHNHNHSNSCQQARVSGFRVNRWPISRVNRWPGSRVSR